MAAIQADIEHPPAPAAVVSGPTSFIGRQLAPVGAPPPAYLQRLDALTAQRRPVNRGEQLFGQGDRLNALYEIHAGWFKTCVSDSTGRCQVTGFQMGGDLLGLDGIDGERHSVAVVALEDALVCVIPFVALDQLLHEQRSLQHEFHRLLSREIVRQQAMLLLLGTMAAEGRIAAFVLDLTKRLHARGYSSSELVLRMTREEIGSYLGLQLETVSRGFSKLQSEGVLTIRNRKVCVVDEVALRRIVNGHA